jgi:hypothetical protein
MLRRQAPCLLEQQVQQGNSDGLWSCFLRWIGPKKKTPAVHLCPSRTKRSASCPGRLKTVAPSPSVKGITEAVEVGKIQSLEDAGVFGNMAIHFYSSKFDTLVRNLVSEVVYPDPMIKFVGKLDVYHRRRFLQACLDADLDDEHPKMVGTLFQSIWRQQTGGLSILHLLDINFGRYCAKVQKLLPVEHVHEFLEKLPEHERQRAYEQLVLVHGDIRGVSKCKGVTPLSWNKVRSIVPINSTAQYYSAMSSLMGIKK